MLDDSVNTLLPGRRISGYSICPENYPLFQLVIKWVEECSKDTGCEGCRCLRSCRIWFDKLADMCEDKDLTNDQFLIVARYLRYLKRMKLQGLN
jgi:hypothetical protein